MPGKKISFAIMWLFVLAVANWVAADWVGYDPNNGQMPNIIDSNWLMGGATNPIVGTYGETVGLSTAGSDKGYWYYLNSGLSSTGYTIDFRVAVDADASPSATPFALYVVDTGEMAIIRIDAANGIVVHQEGAGTTPRGQYNTALGVGYHVYRYVRQGQNFYIYLDYHADPVVSATLLNNNAVPNLDRILFGKGDSLCSGTSGLDYILWDVSAVLLEAPLPPPPPLPDVAGYDPQNSEMPDELDSRWVMAGQTNPIYGFFQEGAVAGLNVSGSDKGAWSYDSAGLSDAGYTLDFKVMVDSDTSPTACPVNLFIYDSGELVILRVGATEGFRVEQEGGGGYNSPRGANTEITTDDTFHTYRYIRQGLNFAVFMDSLAEPLITGTLVDNNLSSYDRVLFGRGDGYCSGTAALDFITWDNTATSYEAPAPLPQAGYDPQDSDPPADGWLLAGSLDPITGFVQDGQVAQLNVTNANAGFWYYDNAGLPSAGYAVNFRAQVTTDPGLGSYPLQITLSDNGEQITLQLGAEEGLRVEQTGAVPALRAENPALSTADDFHTYRYVRDGGFFAVYYDNALDAVLTGAIEDLDNNDPAWLRRVAFGKCSSSAAGAAQLDYLLWNNTGPDYLYYAGDTNKDFNVNLPDFSQFSDAWLTCTDPYAPCTSVPAPVPGGAMLFRDTFDDYHDPNESGLWNTWEGPGTDNVTIIDGKLVMDGHTGGTWRGWNVVGMASKMSFTNPIAHPGNNDKLYMYLWNVTGRYFEADDRFRGESLGFGPAGQSIYDGQVVDDDRVIRDKSAYLYFRADPVGNPGPDYITDGEVWAYGRVARPGYILEEKPGNPDASIDFNNTAVDIRIIMDGSIDGVVVEYKPAGSAAWLRDGGPIFSGYDDYEGDPGTERIDDDPVWVNFGGCFVYVEIDEVYVAVNDDRAAPLAQCGDPEHPYPTADFNTDCYVNLADFVLMAGNWLLSNNPAL